jgi:hypothetical protein
MTQMYMIGSFRRQRGLKVEVESIEAFFPRVFRPGQGPVRVRLRPWPPARALNANPGPCNHETWGHKVILTGSKTTSRAQVQTLTSQRAERVQRGEA